MLVSFGAFAQADDQPVTIEQLKQELVQESNLRYHLKLDVDNLKRKLKISNDSLVRMQSILDSICKVVGINQDNFKQTSYNLQKSIDDANKTIETKADTTELQSKSTIGVVVVVCVVIVLLLLFFLLLNRIKKGNVDVEKLKQKADELNEKVVQSLNSEMEQMTKISNSLSLLQTAKSKDAEPDHSLVKTLADRITFMEMTLSKMDPKTRGFKQLSKSIVQMKENLLEKGYELVELLGKEYKEGMKCIASFIDDEEIEEGKSIITSVKKPQINYNGVMIQSAEIVVSQKS